MEENKHKNNHNKKKNEAKAFIMSLFDKERICKMVVKRKKALKYCSMDKVLV